MKRAARSAQPLQVVNDVGTETVPALPPAQCPGVRGSARSGSAGRVAEHPLGGQRALAKHPLRGAASVGAPCHHNRMRSAGAFHILSPGFVAKASWKPSLLIDAPSARYCGGECGLVVTWLSIASSRIFSRQACEKP
jgi:hypothetical protein